MQRSKLVPLLLALLLVGASGCMGVGGNGSDATETTAADSSQDARQLVNAVNESAQSYDTTRMRMVNEVSIAGQTATSAADIVVNRSSQKGRIDMTVKGSGQSQQTTTYMDIRNETMYTNRGGTWQTQPIPDQYLYSQNQIAQMQKIMTSGEVSFAGNDTVNGTHVRVIEADPEEEAFMDLVEQQMGREMPSEISFEELTYRMYIDPDSELVRKVDMSMVMDTGDRTMSMDMTMWYVEYGADADIEIPEEATDEAAA